MTCYSVYQLPRARIRFDAALLALVLWLAVAASAAGRDQASGCRVITEFYKCNQPAVVWLTALNPSVPRPSVLASVSRL